MIIFNLLFNLFFLISSYNDIKKREIPELCIIIMFLIVIIRLIIYKNFSETYISISIYCLPFYIILILETYLKKELIGLGDIKLMLIIGAYFSNINLYFLNLYYTLMYGLALLYIIIIRPREKYIPFVPMMNISCILLEIYWEILH